MIEQKILKVVILGSTGSIGKQALEVVEKYPGRFKVVGLAANNNVSLLLEQIDRYRPDVVSVTDNKAFSKMKDAASSRVKVLSGMEGLCELASMPEADCVLVSVSGAVGIKPTLAGIKAGKRIALANKETLVAAGDIVMQQVKEHGVLMIPVDSEHSAIFQCIAGEAKHLNNIWITASGGPFRDLNYEQLQGVTVEMALKHPNWAMGPKITIDSASLMNKGLEVIEAHHLFGVDYDQIQVVVQRESIIHSMVELVDGAFIAHLGVPDMRIPIQYALTYPERLDSPAKSLDFTGLRAIHFDLPDKRKFPALELAYSAGKIGGTMPAVLNAANEAAVNIFIKGKIAFTDIPVLVEKVMLKHDCIENPDLDDILEVDKWAREVCERIENRYGRKN